MTPFKRQPVGEQQSKGRTRLYIKPLLRERDQQIMFHYCSRCDQQYMMHASGLWLECADQQDRLVWLCSTCVDEVGGQLIPSKRMLKILLREKNQLAAELAAVTKVSDFYEQEAQQFREKLNIERKVTEAMLEQQRALQAELAIARSKP